MKKLFSIIIALVLCFSLVACVPGSDNVLSQKSIEPSGKYVKYLGRTHFTQDNSLWLSYSATGLEFKFTGTDLSFTMQGPDNIEYMDFGNQPRFAVYVDGELVLDEILREKEKTYAVLNGAPEAEYTVRLIKLSAAVSSGLVVKQINLTSRGKPTPTPKKDLTVEFIGDSITCAYGVEDEDKTHGYSTASENASMSYGYLAAEILDADCSLVCKSGHGIVSGYTADGTKNDRVLMPDFYESFGSQGGAVGGINADDVPWDFAANPVDVVVINLGTNDANYTKHDTKTREPEYEALYIDFLRQIRRCNPNAAIVCTLGTMDNRLFKNIKTAVAAYSAQSGDKNVFAFEIGVRKNDEPLAADWHPSLASQTRAATEIAEFIKSIISK